MDRAGSTKISFRREKSVTYFNMDIAEKRISTVFLKCFGSLFLVLFFHLAPLAQTDSTQNLPVFQSDNLYQWGSISSFHGLPSEKINAIEQTRDGVLWFGSDKGLAKFDGRRVQTITAQNLSTLRILALKATSDGILWIATESGVFRFQDEAYIPLEETRKISINSIYYSEDEQKLYLAGEKGAIFEVYKAIEHDYQVKTLFEENIEIKGISKVGVDLVLATQNRGILSFDGRKLSDVPIKPRFINSFAKDIEGRLWIGAQTFTESSGLYRTKHDGEFEKIDAAVGSVTSLSFDGNQNLWVGTKDRGAFQFRDGLQIKRFTFENTAGGLRANEILTTFVDREDVIWFGTTKGVCRFDPSGPTNEMISDDVQSNFVRTLYRTKSGRLIAGTNRGLFIKEAENSWNEVQGFDSSAIYSISEDEFGLLQIGAVNGFYYGVDLKTESRIRYSEEDEVPSSGKESVRSIRKFKNETYLAFFGRGLATFNSNEISFDKNNPALTQITSLHSDGESVLWIGTGNNGVFAFDGKQIAQNPQLEPLKNTAIWAIAGGGEKGVWFGTESGLYLFRNSELNKILNETDVRNIEVIYDSTGEIETVWCATVNGLTQIAPNENFDWIYSRIDVEQGLSSQSAFALLSNFDNQKLDSILVGTTRGLANYDVSKIRPLLIPTRILSKRLHSASELASGIDLEYPQNSLAVDVAGISSRTFPEQFQYGFLLRNAKGELINKKLSNDSQFLMDNLGAGQYSVEVVAYDKDLTSSKPLVFSFSIGNAPFPFTTLALAVLLSLAIVALIWAVISQRSISRTSSELEFANKELNTARLDLANEAERERRRISRDLHDQTLADLRHLLLLTDKLQTDEDSSETASVIRSEIESVSNEIRNICEDLSPSVLENIGLTASLEWALANSVRDSSKIVSSEFNCDDKADEKLDLTPHVQIQIFRIVQEVLSNIVQHSTATFINFSIQKIATNSLSLTIVDNGQKFDRKKSTLSKGRGLKNIQARANLIEAEISWTINDSGENLFKLKKD